MFIDRLEYAVLLYLQQEPMANISSIASTFGLSFYTAKKVYNKLFAQGLVKGVAAILSPSAINLDKACVFFDVASFEALKQLEKIIDLHSFSRYRSRFVSGDKRGLYVNFEMPKNCFSFLKEFCQKLRKKGIIKEFKIFRRDEGEIRTSVDLSYVNLNSLSWEFDMNAWLSNIKEGASTTLNMALPEIKSNGNFRLNETDLWIMRSITNNAKLGVGELVALIKKETKNLLGKPIIKDISTISRRLKKVKDQYILEYQLLVNNHLFDLHSNVIFDVKTDEKFTNRLMGQLQKEPIPFKSIFNKTKEGFQWYIRCPMDYTTKITNFLWERGYEFKTIQLISPNRLYYFYPFNYDVEKHKWNDSREYFFKPIYQIMEK